MARLYKKQLAEDVTSKAFTIAYEKYVKGMYSEEGKSRAWLIQIARYEMGNYFQKKKEESLSEDYEIMDSKLPIDEVVVTSEQVNRIKQYFSDLEPETREIVTLKIWEEMKFREIAEITSNNESTVKSLYYRGVKKIKNKMEEDERKQYAIVLVGLSKLAQDSMFEPSREFITTTIAGIGSGIAKIFLQMSGKKMITLFGKTFTAKSLIIAGVSTVVGVSAIGGGVYYYQNEVKKDDNDKKEVEEVVAGKEEWKIFTNEDGGYSFEYPSDWEVSQGDLSLSTDATIIPLETDVEIQGLVEVDEPLLEELDNEYLNKEEELLSNLVKYSDRKEIKVDGVKAIRYVVSGTEYDFETDQNADPFKGIRVIMLKDGKEFSISLIKKEKKDFDQSLITIFDKIVESFRFNVSVDNFDEESSVEDVEELPNNKKDGKFIGNIKKVYEKDGKNYLDIDYVQFLSGKEAIVAALEDDACVLYEKGTFNELDMIVELSKVKNMTLDQIIGSYDQDCTPNDFYIRNQNPKLRTFEITSTIFKTATDFENDPDGVRDIIYTEFKGFLEDYQLYNIEVKDEKVVKIEEQYIP